MPSGRESGGNDLRGGREPLQLRRDSLSEDGDRGALRRNHTWTSANPGGVDSNFDSTVSDVSCVSSTNCPAVGTYFNPAFIKHMFVLRWNGASWTTESTPTPAGATDTTLKTIACATATDCQAIGASDVG